MNHSPEPWEVDPVTGGVVDTNGSIVCDAIVGDSSPDDPGPMEDADIERIVACVNACRGIPTSALKAGVIGKFVWNTLMSICWVDCKRFGLSAAENEEPHEGAVLLKKHGGEWEQFT